MSLQKVKKEESPSPRGRIHSSVVEQITFNDKVEGSIPSVFRERRGRGRKGMERKRGFKSLSTKRMARKTHAIGYRLGETRW